MPDLEKLEAMARVFGVTLNELTGTEEPAPRQPAVRTGHMGMALCVAGAGCLILSGVLSLAAPQTAEQINASSTVTINGSGLLMCLSAAVMAVGAWLPLKRK